MCGICGFIEAGVRKEDYEAKLAPMLARIVHRGPDAEGRSHEQHGDWGIALGHRRLSIIDLANGAQPMATKAGTTITYNGELYNFRELRGALESLGRSFRTRSDTEVLLQHVEQHGESGLAALDGMFAFALWDKARGRLVLARDRAGIKPLYYAELPGGGIAFASELASLMQHPAVSRAPSQEGLLSYFFSDYVQPPHAIIAGAKKLRPGHYLVWEDGVLSEQRPFWRMSAPRERSAMRENERELAHELWRILDSAVDRQLVADVPVGIFLSGGLDSSTVAALAAGRSKTEMKAFSIAFEDPTFDESRYARDVAERIGAAYVQETLREKDLVDVVERAVDHLDEPLADASYLPTFLLSRLAARDVKVVLSGDGGDELWGGYPTYRAHAHARSYERLPALIRSRIIAPLVERLPVDDRYQSLEWKLRRFTTRFDADPETRHLRWMSNLDLPDLAMALPKSAGLVPETMRAAKSLPETGDALQRIFDLDFTTYLSGSVLTKVDRASMAFGLEVRPPLLDNAMIDFAQSIPSAYKVKRGVTKALFRSAAQGHLPERVLARPKKGFGIPLARWVRGALREPFAAILESSPVWSWGLERSAFRTWNDEHQAKKADRSKPLWALLVLDRWLRRNGP